MAKVALDNLQDLAGQVLSRLQQKKDRAAVIALVGELGAGKTTFVQALAQKLGITDTVQSPTYVLMKSYPTRNERFEKLVHIDAYRLETPEEFSALDPGLFLNDPRSLVCIEWPERVRGVLPAPDLLLNFSADGAGAAERYIELI